MKTLRISRTIFPTDKPQNFNEWSAWFWGIYGTELEKIKNKKSWDRNIYKPKNK